MKRCTICDTEKPYSEFHNQASRKDGYCSWCKSCKSVKAAEQYQANRSALLRKAADYRAENTEKVSEAKKRCYENKKSQYSERQKAYYEKNREKVLAACRSYRRRNLGAVKETQAAYRESNRERLNLAQSTFQKNNWDRIRVYQANRNANRFKSDPLYALTKTVRRRISLALQGRGFTKSTRTLEMIGCGYEQLLEHLERQFKDGMSWANRGEWHIDHIIPLASATTEKGIIELCHYTNLQPLWAADNLSKGAKMPDKLLALH